MSDTPKVRQVDVREAVRLAREGYKVVDVREPWEWKAGHVAGALHIPMGDVPARFETELPDRSTPLLLHCRSGARSGRVAEYVAQRGYRNVVNLAGLIEEWPAAGGPWEAPAQLLSEEQRRRYDRQLLIPEIGTQGQRRLLEGRVLILGAGGLGAPVALYLAGAGVGTLGVADDDTVDESNLHRQVLHSTADIGRAKTASARERLTGLNPDVRVVEHAERLTTANAEDLLSAYQVVVDGSDNLETRYAVNDAAVRLRKPVVHASAYRWEAQVTTLVPFEGPCYRCLFPAPPPAEMAPDCQVAGVPGVVPGLAGMVQATEALKLLLGVGETLVGRLLTIDALRGEFRETRVARDPACPACGSAS